MAVRYAPVDTARYWRKFFAKYQPRAGLVMEMEFWPAMLETAKRARQKLATRASFGALVWTSGNAGHRDSGQIRTDGSAVP